MKLRGGEILKRADVIVMQMRDHHVFDFGRFTTHQRKTLGGRADKFTLALLGHGLGKAGIDDDFAPVATQQPDKVIHRHRRVVRVAADKVYRTQGVAAGVFDGVDFVVGESHGVPLEIMHKSIFATDEHR